MLRLLLKLLLLAALVLAINLAIAPALPYPWGNPVLDAKLRHLSADPSFDALIVGSSWTYRHLDPAVFDRELGGHAFNLAADGAFPPQIHRLCRVVLESDARRYRYLVVELSRFLSAVDPELGHTREEKHWPGWRDSLAMVRALGERPDKNAAQKLGQGSLLALQSAERYLHAGLGVDALAWRFGPPPDARMLGRERSGFYPVEDEFEDRKGEAFSNLFLADPRAAELLEATRRESVAAFARFARDPRPAMEGEHTRQLRDLARLAHERKIPIAFVLPPRLGARYDLALPVAAALASPPSPLPVIVELADPALHPELYGLDLSVDRTHFNRAGAGLYSRELAALLRRHLPSSGPPAEPADRKP